MYGNLDISCAIPGRYYHFSNHSALNALLRDTIRMLLDAYFECSWILGRRGDTIQKCLVLNLFNFLNINFSFSTNKIIGSSRL